MKPELTREQALEMACRMVLAFHTGGQWTWPEQQEWINGMVSLIGQDMPIEATTNSARRGKS